MGFSLLLGGCSERRWSIPNPGIGRKSSNRWAHCNVKERRTNAYISKNSFEIHWDYLSVSFLFFLSMFPRTLQDFRNYFYKKKNCPDSQPYPLEKVYNWGLWAKACTCILPFLDFSKSFIICGNWWQQHTWALLQRCQAMREEIGYGIVVSLGLDDIINSYETRKGAAVLRIA